MLIDWEFSLSWFGWIRNVDCFGLRSIGACCIVFFFSNDLWNGTRWHVFLRSFSRRDISLWSALGEEQLGVWLNLSQSSLRDSSVEGFSTRDKLSLVTEVRIFFRVVVYRSNKIIWVQNWSIGNFLFWFKMLILLTAVQLEYAVSFSFFSCYFGYFVNRYTITRFVADVLSTRHFIVKCAQRRTAWLNLSQSPSRDSSECEVFSTLNFKTSLGCFLDETPVLWGVLKEGTTSGDSSVI